jgi:phage/conjugal plasmid C-4 type zinc finger TraR family protein
MANGWAGENAVNEQMEATIEDALQRARARLEAAGPSRTHCEECDATIPEARRIAIPGARLCVKCQEEADREEATFSGYNRRGSKDSQLR